MEYLYCALIGYLIGTFNPAYLIGKRKGDDIRERGSGNAGASNVTILYGKARGALCALVDILKTCLAITLTGKLCPSFEHAFALTAASCVLGHIFPVYMKFRGGKGLACLGGTVLMYDRRVFFILLAIEIVVALVTDYICFVPMTASVIFPIIYFVMSRDLVGMGILGVACAVIILKHFENIHRIRSGKEAHLSFLWNKNAEIERLQHNTDDHE